MKIVIRMLMIVTIIVWLIIIFFAITAAVSALNLEVTIGEPKFFPSSSGITFSLPFTINNEGFYEIGDLNLTTQVTNPGGVLLDKSETIISSIPKNTNVSKSHEVTIDLEEIELLDKESLLLEDSELKVDLIVELNFAKVIPIQISTNTTIPWGAPLAQFSVGQFAFSNYNITHEEATIPISFENHAILDIHGTLKIDIHNEFQEQVASGITLIDVPSGSIYSDGVSVYASLIDGLKVTDNGTLHIIFETPIFSIDWNEPYG